MYNNITNSINISVVKSIKLLLILVFESKVVCKLMPTYHKGCVFMVRTRDDLLYLMVVLYLTNDTHTHTHSLLFYIVCRYLPYS